MNNGFEWNGEAYSAANGIQTSVGERLIESIRFSPDMSILDAGCGSGNLTFLLAKKVPRGWVLGIDSSESMIGKARESLAARGVGNIEFKTRAINGIEFDERFDLVYSNSVLHWVVEVEDGLHRLFRALKRGGSLEVQFPLLNPGHPLVRYSTRAIEELGFAEAYEEWTFPWFVPDSEDQLSGMLTDIGFCDAVVSLQANAFSFPSALAAFQHFNSVGLELFAAPLDGEGKRAFFDRVLRDLSEDFTGEATLRYERAFVRARKP